MNTLLFFVGLSILILIHELGHFLVAKRSGVLVEEFGLGLPPRLFGKKIGETIYSFNALPFGGFVRLHGENSEEGVKEKDRAFVYKSKKTRLAILVAGVVMNFLLAVFIFASIYTYTGIPRGEETGRVEILMVGDDTPAMHAELAAGDVVLAVNSVEIVTSSEFIDLIDKVKGEPVVLLVEREGRVEEVSITPRAEHPLDEGPMGVVISSSQLVYDFPPFWQRPFIGAYYGLREALFWGGAIVFGVISIFAGLLTGSVPQDVAGPVGLWALDQEVAKIGIIERLNLMAIVSVNLAILNILPIPALDGGRVVFVFLEKFIGRKIKPKIESAIHTAGFALLILLIVALTYREVSAIRSLGLDGYLDMLGRGSQ